VFNPRYARRRLGLVVYFWSVMAVLVFAMLRLIGLEGTFVTVLQFIPTVLLILAVPLFADIALSEVVPGANDNASGVATVLRLAERYGGRLEHFDVAVVFTGAEEGFALGMRNWIKRNHDELDAETTAVIAVDMAGYGTPRFATKEGLVFGSRFHPTLVEIAEGIDGAEPYQSRSISDAYQARAAGLPALRVTSLPGSGAAPHYHLPTDTPDRLDHEALERTYEFCCELIERIDAEIGPRLP
jgi:Zn-dependent M28 family amino/carboxypeptidase